MAVYKRIKSANGDSQYENVTKHQTVKAEDVPVAVREELDLADPGTEIDEETVTKQPGDGVIDPKTGKPAAEAGKSEEEKKGEEKAPEDPKDGELSEAQKQEQATTDRNSENKKKSGNEESNQDRKDPEGVNPYARKVPQSEPGMGFKRVNGKTVDIFDGKTPHTHTRVVENIIVPLSEKSYNEKTDAEIYDKLKELEKV